MKIPVQIQTAGVLTFVISFSKHCFNICFELMF